VYFISFKEGAVWFMKFKTGLLGILVMVGVLFMGSGLTGHAADTPDQDATDLTAAQASMPQGLPLSDYFTIGNFDGINSAKVQDSTNPNTLGTQAVQLTNGKDQLGTIWAGSALAFDLSRNEKASMWMYFGNKKGQAGDGMAFVLQNDPRGTKATAVKKDGTPASGESMGVWGYPDDVTSTNSGTVASQAIQNSWALEFDTFVNNQYMYDNYMNATNFDNNLKQPHIADGFPAKTGTYQRKPVSHDGINYNYATVMTHQNSISGTDSSFLSNGAWHHLTLDWTASTNTMTYTIDDKDPTTGLAQAGQSRSETISSSDLGGKTTALWGFTGSTGGNSESNLVSFEQIPGLVDSSATGTVTDLTQNKKIADGDSVNTNDRLQLDYQLTYNSGSAPWTNVRASLKIPTGITPTKGIITNPDGTTSSFDVSNMTDQTLKTTLAQSLTKSNPTAKITILAKASSTATTVPSSQGNFVGSNAITSATMNGFKVNQLTSSLTLLLMSQSTVNLDAGQGTTITGMGSVLNGKVGSKGITLHPTLNGQELATTQFSQGSFSYDVPAGSLKTGNNTLDLYATDTLGDVSNDLQVTIHVAGTLNFGDVSSTSTFKPTALIGTTQDILPANDWQLDVKDTRGAGNHWQLQASATPFVDDAGHQLDGQLRYRTSSDDLTLTSTPTTVATGTSSDDGTTTNVASGWNATTGLHMQVSGGAVAGTYKGEVKWILANAPQ